MKMKRLKYISRFTRDMSANEISALVARAAEKNEALGITGILMSSGRIFYQVIEGPDHHVDELYQQILADDRHRNVLLLDTESNVASRFFPDWSMKKFDLDHTSVERLEPVRENLLKVLSLRREIDRLTLALERAVWHELASGMTDPADT